MSKYIAMIIPQPANVSSLKKFNQIEPYEKAFLINPGYYSTEDKIDFLPGYMLSKVRME
jgi:hypothetical protein